MIATLSNWFGTEMWVALAEIGVAAVVDMILTVALIMMGKLRKANGHLVKFSWRQLPQFVTTNLPYAVALVLGAVLVKFQPELREEYLLAATGVAAWLARDWRGKFTVLIGVKPPRYAADQT